MKETTGKRIRLLMKEREIKQADILRLCEPYCEKYGVKLRKNDLSQYVSDKVQPRQDKLSILGMALGVSEAWLMGYDVPMRRETPAAVSENISFSNEEKEIVLAYRISDSLTKAMVLRALGLDLQEKGDVG